MQPYLRSFMLLALIGSSSAMFAQEDLEALEAEASALAQQFVATLKPQLMEAITEGGPAHAVQVCAEIAPHIAHNLSLESAWEIRRVSLKTRNVNNATPDDFERSVLLDFDARHAAGESLESLVRKEVVNGEYRYVRAQAVEPLCLTCHGQVVAPEIEEALSRYYPDDSARGYLLGDIRGAISVRRMLR